MDWNLLYAVSHFSFMSCRFTFPRHVRVALPFSFEDTWKEFWHASPKIARFPNRSHMRTVSSAVDPALDLKCSITFSCVLQQHTYYLASSLSTRPDQGCVANYIMTFTVRFSCFNKTLRRFLGRLEARPDDGTLALILPAHSHSHHHVSAAHKQYSTFRRNRQ